MKKRYKIIMLIIIFILISFNLSYNAMAGLFFCDYIEIELINYNDNYITIKDSSGEIIEDNESDTSLSWKIYKNDYEGDFLCIRYYGQFDYENPNVIYDSIEIEITNNKGEIDSIEYSFDNTSMNQLHYLKYDCNNGKVKDISFFKNYEGEIMIATVVIGLILVVIVISVILYHFISRKKKHNSVKE